MQFDTIQAHELTKLLPKPNFVEMCFCVFTKPPCIPQIFSIWRSDKRQKKKKSPPCLRATCVFFEADLKCKDIRQIALHFHTNRSHCTKARGNDVSFVQVKHTNMKLDALHAFQHVKSGASNRRSPLTTCMRIKQELLRLAGMTANAMPSWCALCVSNYSHVRGLPWHPIRRSPHPRRPNVVVSAPELPPFPPNHPDATRKQQEDPLNFMNGTWPREGQSIKTRRDRQKEEKVGGFLPVSSSLLARNIAASRRGSAHSGKIK